MCSLLPGKKIALIQDRELILTANYIYRLIEKEPEGLFFGNNFSFNLLLKWLHMEAIKSYILKILQRSGFLRKQNHCSFFFVMGQNSAVMSHFNIGS